MAKRSSKKKSTRVLSNNKVVLYSVFIAAVLNIIYYLNTNNIDSVIFLALVGYVASFFTKNMIYILIAAMTVAFLFADMKSKRLSFFEGHATMGAASARRRKKGKGKKPPRPSTTVEQKLVEGIDDTKVENKERIDHATTTTNAFKDLSAIVGDKGIQNMTRDTVSLMEQQKSLMESLKSMEPMINTTRGFLENMNIGGLSKTK
jgi:hypothetical protein